MKKKSEVVVAEPVVVEPLPVFEECESTDAAERVRFHLSQARVAGRVALAHIIEAGRELALQKQLLGYGQWSAWCDRNLDIAQKTADRYIETFQRTIGVQRTAQGVALDKKILKKELEAATFGMEEKTVRQAMLELGVIKPTPGHGGAREGAGRKPKGDAEVAAELKAIAKSEPVLWASAKGSLDNLVQLDAKRDVFHRLSGDHLATVANLLADLSDKAAKALAQRLGDGTPTLPTNL